MRGHRRRSSSEFGSDSDSAAEGSGGMAPMKCVSCREEYEPRDAGTCRECYEEASETEDELKREIDDLKSKVAFLRLWSPLEHHHHHHQRSTACFTDVVLVAAADETGKPAANPVPVPAHRAVLASRSPVFRAMLENEMEESLSGTIKISDVSYDALRTFVNYLYTAEACLDEQMGCDLLVLAEKYQVKHLKTYCEKFMVSKLSWENALLSFAFAHQHNAKNLLDSALSIIMDNMDKLSKREEYMELVEKDPRLLVEIYEAYLSKQVNTAARKDSSSKS
ncbi:BTB/POZ domain-containing protein [Actinidia chinensis var. chinensis]|uniref:BTB/POZ domain-containing protein n=1 Tax=Actinidia chinensis var. chinensis TaxID=1590841 RepID=A0A2R6R2J0_ACTCC|nr:BTB/POZ domain-containing protein At4g08455 [Actinidia eriantha]PSS19459.1 BTB/POZ domain-containing protein [Actinidia chinensis var. chinensis]